MTRKDTQKQTHEEHLTIWDLLMVGLQTMKHLLSLLYVLVLLFGLLGLGMGLGYFASQIDGVEVPERDRLLAQVEALSRLSEMTYADGSLISPIDSDLLRTPVDSSAISQNIKNAIIATEDETFMSHKGVLPKAVFRATLTSVLGIGETSGGSTLTQQLIKQQILGSDPTFKRKSQEMIYALELERHLDKDAILTNYLNVSPFGRNNRGQNIAGVEEAAQGIFGVSARDLTIPQAAFLAGLPQSPIVYSPYTSYGTFKSDEDMAIGLKRAQNVLYNLYRTGVLTQAEYDDYKAYDLRQDFKQPEAIEGNVHDYLYYTVFDEAVDRLYDYLLAQDQVSERDRQKEEVQAAYLAKANEALRLGGYQVVTTIHRPVHDAMQAAAAQYGHLLDDGTGRVEMGNVLMDNRTGAVLGFVGGRDYTSNQNNHAFDTKRSPGSTIKPILAYGIAIDQGLMGSASVLSNYPTTFGDGQDIMHVDSKGTAAMSLQDALNASVNIPAFWTYKLLQSKGVDVKGYMEKMGYSIPEYNIESLPLGGGADVSVAQQTNGYQTLANGGLYHEKHVVQRIVSNDGTVIYEHESAGEQVYSPAGASIMTELLKGPLSSAITTSFLSDLRAINPGLASGDWIGKTGTSNFFADSWLMVSTPAVTLGNWSGHDDNTSLSRQSGLHNARYVARLVAAIHQADPGVLGLDQRFGLAPGVVASTVLTQTGTPPGTATINGRQFSINGATTTSYWVKNGAPALNYDFMIGGTAGDHQKAWAALGAGTTEASSSSDQDEESSSSSSTEEASDTATETSSED